MLAIHAEIHLFRGGVFGIGRPLGAQSPPDAASPRSQNTYLELGKLIEREMRGGEKHFYKAHAEAGQFVRVVVLQKGSEISVTLLDPSGKQGDRRHGMGIVVGYAGRTGKAQWSAPPPFKWDYARFAKLGARAPSPDAFVAIALITKQAYAIF